MDKMLTQLLFGFVLAGLIALLAWKAGSLSKSGAAAATISGGLIFGLGGLAWAMLLLTFFISSSILSRAFASRKTRLSEKFSKGSRRDWGQVLANGGLGAGLVVVSALLPEQNWPWVAYAGAMAAVNADTWATELGVLSRRPPRLITNWRVVEPGTSGGISLLGSLVALAGAALVGLAAALFSGGTALFLAAAMGGLAGSFIDSWLGATFQAIYFCPVCQKETERHPLHTCGNPTSPLRGQAWLNNDVVNFTCSLAGALAGAGLYILISRLV
jgi:uncharacterized protein (TIGR00297 family)